MLVFLDINNISIECRDDDLVNLGLGIASGKYDYTYIRD